MARPPRVSSHASTTDAPQACCAQQTLTIPPDVYGFATTKEPVTNTRRGWCHKMGRTPPTPEDPDHPRREAGMSDPYVKIGPTET